MDFDEIIRQRRSITSYKDIPLTQEQWTTIVEAGTFAPNVGNIQDWRFVVVQSQDGKKKIAEACHKQMWMTQAAVHIICCSDVYRTKTFYGQRGEMLYAIQNVAAAAENMLLKATEMGLGTNWVGDFDEKELSKAIRASDDIRVQAVLTIGYANEVRPTPQKQPLRTVCFFENYGGLVSPEEDRVYKYKYAEIAKTNTSKVSSALQAILRRVKK